MYKDWQITRWDTPLFDLKSVAMVSLVDDGCPPVDGADDLLHLVVEIKGYRGEDA